MIKTRTKVLIIDDNYSILEYLKTILSKYNFEIKTSRNGYEGLQDLAEFKPDIIFLDLMMPNIDGIQMLQLKKVLNDIKDIPVIVISANAGRNNVMAAMEAGADRVLSKPINIKQLKSTVDEVLGGSYFESNFSTTYEFSNSNVKDKECSILREKFGEFREDLQSAIKNRDSLSIKRIASLLKEYAKEFANTESYNLLNDLDEKDYQKPSDWMFAELRVKELTQNLKELV
jgi:DNA-binding response OmpR family regulator